MEKGRQGHSRQRLAAAHGALIGAVLAVAAVARAAEAVPVLVRTAPGRFEISAVDSARAHALAAEAEAAWRELSAPFDLPAAFPTPIYLRAVAAPPEPILATAETGGIVSVRLDEGATPTVVRRAIVRGLLLRLAVARHGASERLHTPAWLVEAGVGWWRTRAEAAQLDALKHATEGRSPPPLAEVLHRKAEGEPRPEFSAASVWLLAFLQAESGRAREWPTLLTRLLRGDDPEIALAVCYGDRFGQPADRELWWHVGWHQAVRARTLPALSTVESRVQLGALARFVFAGATEQTDAVLPLATVLAHAAEPIVAAELARRAAELSRAVPTLHPFYRNAGLSLAEAFASRTAASKKREAASAAFAQDWRDAVELETATTAALDALEKR